MDTTSTHKRINRTLAVVNGGLNFKVDVQKAATLPKPKLLDQVRQAIHARHYSPKTEESYVHCIKRFIFFHSKRHPAGMGEREIAQFLSSLASELRVSASAQNQALNGILFLYRAVMRKEIGYVDGVIRAKRPHRLPVVLTRQEVKSILGMLDRSDWLMVMLLYGAGLRLMECLQLRIKDIDFTSNQIIVRAGKGDKDRHTMFPTAVKEPLAKHVEIIKEQHRRDLERGLGRVALPNALDRKYPTPEKSGAGNGYFPQLATTRIGKPESNADITCTNPFCRRW
jgi:site-specific recombinase XerD